MTKQIFFVGATICGAPDGEQYFSAVKVPGTMSKPETINAHLEKTAAERRRHMEREDLGFAGSILTNDDTYENHAHRPMVGVLASVTVLDATGTTVYHQAEKMPVTRGKVALPFVRYLTETFPYQFGETLPAANRSAGVPFFGFNLKQVLRIAAFEALRCNLTTDARVNVPVRLWHNPVHVYDVRDVLLTSSDQRDLDLYSLLKYFDVDATAEQLARSAQTQAQVAHALVERAQLMNYCTYEVD